MAPRTAARIAAVQALYQMDLAGTDVNAVIDEFVRLRFPGTPGGEAPAGADAKYFSAILHGVVRRGDGRRDRRATGRRRNRPVGAGGCAS